MEKQILNEEFRRMQKLAGIKLNEDEKVKANKTIYVLVGPPSVGKSTWIKQTFDKIQPFVINRDDIVEKVADQYGWTYDDLFQTPIKDIDKEGDIHEKYGTVIKSPIGSRDPLSYDKVLEANKKVQDIFNQRVAQGKGKENIVVDMTNMSAGARKGALKAIEGAEDEYRKIAVVFNFKGAEDIIKKMAVKRSEEMKAQGKSKTIPPEAFDRMFSNFQQVSSEEGFDEVINVDNIEKLKQSLIDPSSSLLKENILKIITEAKKAKETFEEFATTRAAGAAKIASTAEEKGGLAMLTYNHFKVKAPYYKKAINGKFDKEAAKKEFAEILKSISLDMNQNEFQRQVGKMEVLGELLIREK